MNTVILMGRLVRDPDIRYPSNGDSQSGVAHYRLAVDRRFRREGQPDADFFDCVVFGRQVEFTEKYLHQGTKLVIQGRLQNDNYTDKDGRNVYRTQIVVENQEFAESKAASQQNSAAFRPAEPAPRAEAPRSTQSSGSNGDFMNIPNTMEEDLPFM